MFDEQMRPLFPDLIFIHVCKIFFHKRMHALQSLKREEGQTVNKHAVLNGFAQPHIICQQSSPVGAVVGRVGSTKSLEWVEIYMDSGNLMAHHFKKFDSQIWLYHTVLRFLVFSNLFFPLRRPSILLILEFKFQATQNKGSTNVGVLAWFFRTSGPSKAHN